MAQTTFQSATVPARMAGCRFSVTMPLNNNTVSATGGTMRVQYAQIPDGCCSWQSYRKAMYSEMNAKQCEKLVIDLIAAGRRASLWTQQFRRHDRPARINARTASPCYQHVPEAETADLARYARLFFARCLPSARNQHVADSESEHHLVEDVGPMRILTIIWSCCPA